MHAVIVQVPVGPIELGKKANGLMGWDGAGAMGEATRQMLPIFYGVMQVPRAQSSS